MSSSISIYKNFQNLPQEIQQKLLEFEQTYKSVKDLPDRFVRDTPSFIYKALLVHGDKYDYYKVEYINSGTKIHIICRIHGGFLQSSNKHLFRKQNCPKCAKNYKSNLEEFVEKAKKVHKDKYSYDKFVYVNSDTKGIITCKNHGDFEQIPESHLQGHGCAKCANQKNGNLYKSNLEEFIEKAKKVHKDSKSKYTYDKFDYVNNRTKSTITCDKHGDFEQSPSNHLIGHGCPKCRNEKTVKRNRILNRIIWSDRFDEGILYLIECWNDVERFVKIGLTAKTVEERYNSSKSMPYNYKILKEVHTDSKTVSKSEREILKLFKSYTPLISFGGESECLQLSEKDFIINHLEILLDY